MSDIAVNIQDLHKSFGDHVVLDGIDLEVTEGTVLALIGPNGSGKTTTVWILSTILAADAGVVRVAGHDVRREPAAVRRAIGVTGQFSALDNLLSGEENLMLMADLAHLSSADGRRRCAELLEKFDLVEAGKKSTMSYSGGMRRRLDLAMTLVARPRVIFLDEPTTGLDPHSRRTMWGIIEELAASGVTIFLTTQQLEEADRLADHVALLDQGKIVSQGTPAELKKKLPGGHLELRFANFDDLDRAAGLESGHIGRDDSALTLRLATNVSVRTLRALFERLDDQAVSVESLSLHTSGLEDVYFALTLPAGFSHHKKEGQPR